MSARGVEEVEQSWRSRREEKGNGNANKVELQSECFWAKAISKRANRFRNLISHSERVREKFLPKNCGNNEEDGRVVRIVY